MRRRLRAVFDRFPWWAKVVFGSSRSADLVDLIRVNLVLPVGIIASVMWLLFLGGSSGVSPSLWLVVVTLVANLWLALNHVRRRLRGSQLGSVAVVVVILIAVGWIGFFSALYLGESSRHTNSFNEALDHTDALYFSLAVDASKWSRKAVLQAARL